MKRPVLLLIYLCYFSPLFSQTADSTFIKDTLLSKTLNEVTVKAYEHNRKLVEVAAPVSLVSNVDLNRFSNISILPALNDNPGIRMEERSPGSYRLNIRGSSLRSEFGVRDVKIYFNEIPLTDPSGNTYLNQLSFYNFQSVEIIKGPAGSLYGAGIGGAMLINSIPLNWQKGIDLNYSYGSFATNNINANIRAGDEDHKNIFNYSHQESDGYRQQSQMRRDIASWENELKVNEKQTIHAYMLYSDLFYQTPGGLTATEYHANPQQARPPSGPNAGAVENKAAIYQKTFVAGFSNEYDFNSNWKNTTAVYGAYTNFVNPGIRVYEIRNEPHFGGRSVFQYKKQINETTLQINFGTEAQKGFFGTKDYANNLGAIDTLQTDNAANIWQYMIFGQADLKLPHGWIITAGASYNKSSIQNTELSNVPPILQTQTFENKIPPRLAILKKIAQTVSVYGSIARGFSTPTTAELTNTNGSFNTSLQPEDGTDYELGLRGNLFHNKLYFDLNVFFFDLHNTIVERIDSGGIFYYVNAGATRQNGIETHLSYIITDHPNQFISYAKIWISHAYDDFHYVDFKQLSADYSGNYMPGVAKHIIVTGIDANTKIGLYTNVTYTYTDKIWLNDANTSYAGSYNLLGARVGYRKILPKRFKLEIFAGADNIFNTKYSLGNDINAAAGRYYNAAPGVNYFAGVAIGNFFKRA